MLARLSLDAINDSVDDRDLQPDGAREGGRPDVLATLVEVYEAKHFPLDLPDPYDAKIPVRLTRCEAQLK